MSIRLLISTAPPVANPIVPLTPIPDGVVDDVQGYSLFNDVSTSLPYCIVRHWGVSVHVYSDAGATATVKVQQGPTPTGPWADVGADIEDPDASGVVRAIPVAGDFVRINVTARSAGNVRATLSGIASTNDLNVGAGDVSLQATSPGATDTGHIHISGTQIAAKFLAGNGTAGAPSIAATSTPTMGFYFDTDLEQWNSTAEFVAPIFFAGDANRNIGDGGINLLTADAIKWARGLNQSADVGLARVGDPGAGVLKVTDGSTGAGKILVGDGTAAAPSYSFASNSGQFGFYTFGVGAIGVVTDPGHTTFVYSNLTGKDFGMTSGGSLGWTSSPTAATGVVDTSLTRRAPATVNLGWFDAAAPVAQTLSAQGARDSIDADTAAVSTTFQGSLGTGTGATGDLVFKVGTPQNAGSTQHVAATALTLHNAGSAGTANVLSTFANGVSIGTHLRINSGTTGGFNFNYNTANTLRLGASLVFGWTDGSDTSATIDTGLARSAAGVLKVTDGSSGLGDLMLNIPSYANNAAAVAALGANRLYYTDVAGEYVVKLTH